nr:hypothetical protein [Paraburkholderia sp. BL8N3]
MTFLLTLVSHVSALNVTATLVMQRTGGGGSNRVIRRADSDVDSGKPQGSEVIPGRLNQFDRSASQRALLAPIDCSSGRTEYVG